MKTRLSLFILLFSFSLFANNFGYLLKINGGINPASRDYIASGIEKSQRDGAHVLVIQLNTPGGLLNSTRMIVQDMLKSEVPIVIYISPSGAQAGSAGVMLTLASNVAAMAPATNIGAAHPVSSTGKDIAKEMNKKIENDTIAFVKSIAEHRGRNIKWAELSVKKSASITSTEALQKKVIDFIAKDLSELMKMIHGRKLKLSPKDKNEIVLNTDNIELRPIEMNTMQKFIMQISEPNIAYILMMAGMLGLYVEFTHPGLIFPGVAGAVCLILSFVSLQTLPINVGALLLLALGVAFLIAEIFVTSFGILSIGGIISLFLGSVFLIDSSTTDATISFALIIPTVLTLSAFIVFIGTLVIKSRWLPKQSGKSAMIGREAVVEEDLTPLGKVYMDSSLWNAETDDGSNVSKGEKVLVTRVDGLKLFVKKAKEA